MIKLKTWANVARFIKTKQIQTLKKGTLFLSRCKPTIDLTTFELGCLDPAVSNGSIFSFCVWFYLTLAITVKILLFTCIWVPKYSFYHYLNIPFVFLNSLPLLWFCHVSNEEANWNLNTTMVIPGSWCKYYVLYSCILCTVSIWHIL